MIHICDYGCGQEAKFQFKNGKWCCSKNILSCPVLRKRTPFEDIIKFVENEDYELLTSKEEYENNCSKKLWFRCPEGHEFLSRWDIFKRGCRCPECANKKVGEKLRTPFEDIKKFVEDEGFELLTSKEEYKNQYSKLWFRCSKGHEFSKRLDSFKVGFRCKKCNDKKRSEKQFNEAKRSFENEGYKILSEKEDYKNIFSKLRTICSEGHEYETSWNNFKSGSRCKKCANKKSRTQFKEIIKFVENEGYELLSKEEDYKNQLSKLKIKCPKNHNYITTWLNFKSGNRCRECYEKRRLGTYHSQETIKNMRLSAIQRIESRNGQIFPNYNLEGCKMIDEYGKENGYNFQHAENGGEYHIKELGYWVDGYDKEKNVVIEIDEPAHFDKNGNLSKKDLERQKEIEDFLGCRFIRLRI